MAKPNIIILNFNSLYQILFEIKNNLSFGIQETCMENLEKGQFKDCIILTKSKLNKDLAKDRNIISFSKKDDQNIEGNNFYNIKLPIDIYSLIEKINITIIKYKYKNQAQIKILDYILDLNSRIISKNGKKLKLTEKEVNIIIFLNEKKIPQTINILQNEIWGYSSELETHTVETHVYRLRKKIIEAFQDNDFIKSHENGYLLK